VRHKIKVLAVNTAGLTMNGITAVIYDYYAAMDLEPFAIDVLSVGEYSSSLVEAFEELGITIYYLPSRKEELAKYMAGLIKLFQKKHYDILHVHGNSATLAIELWIAKLCGCKVRIAHSHNTTCDYKKADKALRPLFNKGYTHAFACGQKAGEWLYNKKDFYIMKNGRDIMKYRFNLNKREDARESLALEKTTLAIGHIGNFNEQKNHEFLIQVFHEVYKERNDAKLFLAGFGPNENQIKSLVKALGLKDRVVFLGVIDNVHEILQAMDVMLLPSLYEGLPLVVVEWQIAALPCIISEFITRECVYTDLVRFLPLNCGHVRWAKSILEIDTNERKLYAEPVVRLTREHDYDIVREAERLAEFYLQCRDSSAVPIEGCSYDRN
jgi:glycosyltransferase involved in cell wall biosynthesis